MKIEEPSDERLLELCNALDETLNRLHTTTFELVVVAQQAYVSAIAQMVEDNPNCNREELCDSVADEFRKALRAQVLNPDWRKPGEA